jgi:hypothetical protein
LREKLPNRLAYSLKRQLRLLPMQALGLMLKRHSDLPKRLLSRRELPLKRLLRLPWKPMLTVANKKLMNRVVQIASETLLE